jgi:thiamine pyrophosphokinase
MMHALIFANGDINDGPMVRRALAAAAEPLVVAADGGARAALHFDLKINAVIGDMDSLTIEDAAQLAPHEVDVQRFPREKDATDLELALSYVVGRGARWIRIIGGVGDRLDQTLGNIYLLALPILVDMDVRLAAGRQEVWLLRPGDHLIEGAPGDTLSLIPLGGTVHGVRTENLYYPLRDEMLLFGPARGLSNVMNAKTARVSLREGVLLAVHTVGKA